MWMMWKLFPIVNAIGESPASVRRNDDRSIDAPSRDVPTRGGARWRDGGFGHDHETVIDEQPADDTPEQASFRAEVRAFLASHAEPKQDRGPWALNFHTSAEEARRDFESGR